MEKICDVVKRACDVGSQDWCDCYLLGCPLALDAERALQKEME